MVYVDLTREEIREMVEKHFRDDDGISKIYTNGAVDRIVDTIFSYENDGIIRLNLRDYFHYNITFWNSVEEARENGHLFENSVIIEDNNRDTEKCQVIIIEY